jgi:hypothetical protein
MCGTSLEFEATVVGVARTLTILPFPLLWLSGDLVKLLLGLAEVVEARRRWHTATGAPPSALTSNKHP